MKQISSDPRRFKPVRSPEQHMHEGIKPSMYRDCKMCGKRFRSNYKYWTCYRCSRQAAAQHQVARPNKMDNASVQAILAVEKRKAEIAAARRKK